MPASPWPTLRRSNCRRLGTFSAPSTERLPALPLPICEVSESPCYAALAVAAPVVGEEISLTNSPWSFTRAELCRATGLEGALVLNDFPGARPLAPPSEQQRASSTRRWGRARAPRCQAGARAGHGRWRCRSRLGRDGMGGGAERGRAHVTCRTYPPDSVSSPRGFGRGARISRSNALFRGLVLPISTGPLQHCMVGGAARSHRTRC